MRAGTGLRIARCAILSLFLLSSSLSACSPPARLPFTGPQEPEFYQPPPPLPPSPTSPDPTPEEAARELQESAPTASPTPECTNHLTFLEDVTIPDGERVRPGQALDKGWLMQNSGSCSWDGRYRIRLIAGDPLGAPEEQALYPALSGTTFEIHIPFTAPEQPGEYHSAWQAFAPDGQPFGDPFYVQIVVQEEETP
jgi:next-to-BRCA1 protein 1